MAVIKNPFDQWVDPTIGGRVIYNANIYVGQPDTDPTIPENRLQVYYIDENQQRINLAQPLTTNTGGFTVISKENPKIIQIEVDSDNYSITVQDRNQVTKWVIENVKGGSPVIKIDDVTGLRDELDNRAVYLTLSEAQSLNLSVGQLVIVTDRFNAPMIVRASGLTPDGYRVVARNDGTSLEVNPIDGFTKATWYGAGPSLINNTPAIHAARDQMNDGDVIFFDSTTYPITEPIEINKRLNLEGNSYRDTIIRNDNTAGLDAVVFSVTWYQSMKNMSVYGNSQSGNGIRLNSSNFVLERVESRENGQHGMIINPNSFTISIIKSLFRDNELDGLYAVSDGPTGQINAVYIRSSSLTLNTRNGATLSGTVINISDSNIEGNDNIGVIITTQLNSVYGINIKDNYIESNPFGHVKLDLYPSLGNNMFNCNIDGNYMFMNVVGADNPNVAFISASTDTTYEGIIGLEIGRGNMYLTDLLPHVDLGNAIDAQGQSKIYSRMTGDTSNPNLFYKNLGNASIETYQDTTVISGFYYARGAISYTSQERSAEINGTINAAATSVTYPITLKSGTLLKSVEVRTATDNTDYNVTFTIFKRDTTGIAAYSAATLKAVNNISGSSLVSSGDFNLLTNPDNVRIQSDEEYYLEITCQGNAGSGTFFYLYNPILTNY